MMPYLYIGSLALPMYWLMIGVAAVLILVMTILQREQYGLTVPRAVLFVLLLAMLAGVCGTLFAQLDNTLKAGGESLYHLNSDVLGTVLLAPFVIPLFSRICSIPARNGLNICAKGMAILLMFTRIGCFFAGCCGGKYVYLSGNLVRLPVRILESAGCFVIFLFLQKYEERKGGDVDLYPLFLLTYCPMRFLLDFMRTYSLVAFGLNVYQFHCIAGIILGLILFFWFRRRRERREKRAEQPERSGAAG